jgi:hypothetical protein
VFAPNVRGANGLWSSSLTIFNQTDQPITARVVGAFPVGGAGLRAVPF